MVNVQKIYNDKHNFIEPIAFVTMGAFISYSNILKYCLNLCNTDLWLTTTCSSITISLCNFYIDKQNYNVSKIILKKVTSIFCTCIFFMYAIKLLTKRTIFLTNILSIGLFHSLISTVHTVVKAQQDQANCLLKIKKNSMKYLIARRGSDVHDTQERFARDRTQRTKQGSADTTSPHDINKRAKEQLPVMQKMVQAKNRKLHIQIEQFSQGLGQLYEQLKKVQCALEIQNLFIQQQQTPKDMEPLDTQEKASRTDDLDAMETLLQQEQIQKVIEIEVLHEQLIRLQQQQGEMEIFWQQEQLQTTAEIEALRKQLEDSRQIRSTS